MRLRYVYYCYQWTDHWGTIEQFGKFKWSTHLRWQWCRWPRVDINRRLTNPLCRWRFELAVIIFKRHWLGNQGMFCNHPKLQRPGKWKRDIKYGTIASIIFGAIHKHWHNALCVYNSYWLGVWKHNLRMMLVYVRVIPRQPVNKYAWFAIPSNIKASTGTIYSFKQGLKYSPPFLQWTYTGLLCLLPG